LLIGLELVCEHFVFYRGAFGRIMRMLRSLSGPSYDGKYLHEVVRKKLGNTRLHQTLTNVVIPTFDIKRLQPTIFSSYEVSLSLSDLLEVWIWVHVLF
jgi:patatin-like phospholipase/acyl hydrolase